MINRAESIKNLLIKYGYEQTESHLNEWNRVIGWDNEQVFMNCLKAIRRAKEAAYIMAGFSAGQASSIDMMMYYDTRPGSYNAAFDFPSSKPLMGYYPFYWYGMFYDMVAEIKAENTVEDMYTLCGVNENNKVLSVLTYYTSQDDKENKQIRLDFGKTGKYEIYLLDDNHTNEWVATTADLTFDMAPNSCILIKEI